MSQKKSVYWQTDSQAARMLGRLLSSSSSLSQSAGRREVALAGQTLNRRYSGWRQHKLATGQVLFHMMGVGGASERQHADCPSKGEHNLGRRGVGLGGKARDGGMAQYVGICGEKREPLIGDLLLLAEKPHVAVPAETGVAAVLDKRRSHGVDCRHLLKLSQSNVAHPEKT